MTFLGRYKAEDALFAQVADKLGAPVVARLLDLVAPAASRDSTGGDDAAGVLALIRSVPGNVSLESMLTEIDKLLAVRAVAIPADVFAEVAPKVVAGWRGQASFGILGFIGTFRRWGGSAGRTSQPWCIASRLPDEAVSGVVALAAVIAAGLVSGPNPGLPRSR
jgi:hypothetical protein